VTQAKEKTDKLVLQLTKRRRGGVKVELASTARAGFSMNCREGSRGARVIVVLCAFLALHPSGGCDRRLCRLAGGWRRRCSIFMRTLVSHR
jgi:hypothetical protein